MSIERAKKRRRQKPARGRRHPGTVYLALFEAAYGFSWRDRDLHNWRGRAKKKPGNEQVVK